MGVLMVKASPASIQYKYAKHRNLTNMYTTVSFLGYLTVVTTAEHLQVEKFRVNRFIMAQILFSSVL